MLSVAANGETRGGYSFSGPSHFPGLSSMVICAAVWFPLVYMLVPRSSALVREKIF